MRKYFRLLWLFGKRDAIAQTAYRPSFILAVTGKVARVFIFLLFFQGLFSQVPAVGQWTFNDSLFLVAILNFLGFLIGITFMRNLAFWFPQSLWAGRFDFMLTKPANTLFLVSFDTIDFFDTISIVPNILLLWYAFNRLGPLGSGDILLGVLLFLLALVLLFAIYLAVAATAFWTVQGSGAGRLVESFLRAAMIPTDTLPTTIKTIFTFVLPVALLATFPTMAFLGRLPLPIALYGAVFTVVALVGSWLLWQRGLRHYVSVGG